MTTMMKLHLNEREKLIAWNNNVGHQLILVIEKWKKLTVI